MGDYEEIMIMMGDNASFFCVFGHYTNSISMESNVMPDIDEDRS